MIKSIINGLGAVLNGVAKVASAINKSTAFKFVKGFYSATIGIPLALVGSVVTAVAWSGIKIAGVLDSKIIKDVFGSSIWEDTAWASRAESTEKFFNSMWEVSLYAHLKVAKFFGYKLAKRQSEAGLGDTGDDIGNEENTPALDPSLQEAAAGRKIGEKDSKAFSPMIYRAGYGYAGDDSENEENTFALDPLWQEEEAEGEIEEKDSELFYRPGPSPSSAYLAGDAVEVVSHPR